MGCFQGWEKRVSLSVSLVHRYSLDYMLLFCKEHIGYLSERLVTADGRGTAKSATEGQNGFANINIGEQNLSSL